MPFENIWTAVNQAISLLHKIRPGIDAAKILQRLIENKILLTQQIHYRWPNHGLLGAILIGNEEIKAVIKNSSFTEIILPS